MLLHIR